MLIDFSVFGNNLWGLNQAEMAGISQKWDGGNTHGSSG